jgi:hypothetical protein
LAVTRSFAPMAERLLVVPMSLISSQLLLFSALWFS